MEIVPASAMAARIRSGTPFVAVGLIGGFGDWTLGRIAADYGTLPTCVRLHPRSDSQPSPTPYEGECVYCQASLAEYCHWLDGSLPLHESNPLARFPRSTFVGYCDYQDMSALFASAPTALDSVDWSSVLAAAEQTEAGAPRDGSRSTLWLGCDGASTPVHYDSYGINFVAQLVGTKRWRLRPPTAAGMRPSRVPYEESSVFAEEAADGRGGAFGSGQGGGGVGEGGSREGGGAIEGGSSSCEHERWLDVELQPGQVLHVPRHWWHGVLTTSHHALSINTWLDAPQDDAERVREAVVRLLAGSLIRSACEWQQQQHADAVAGSDEEPACGWVNPTEDLGESVEADLLLLDAAVLRAEEAAEKEACGECADRGDDVGSEQQEEEEEQQQQAAPTLSALEVARALCIGPAIEAAAQALGRRLEGSATHDASGVSGADADCAGSIRLESGGQQLRAPLARLLRCALIGAQSNEASCDSLHQQHPMGLALARLRAAPGASKIRLGDVINALCTGRALDEIVPALGLVYQRQRQAAGFQHLGSAGVARKRDRAATDEDLCTHAGGACDCDPSCVVS